MSDKPEEEKKSEESPNASENPDEEKNKKSEESSQTKIDSTSQEIMQSPQNRAESSDPAQEIMKSPQNRAESSDPAQEIMESPQNRAESTDPAQEIMVSPQNRAESTDPAQEIMVSPQNKAESTDSAQEKKESSKSGHNDEDEKVKTTRSAKQIVIWTMTGFFDFNPGYMSQLRGFTNLLHVILSLADIVLLAITCQIKAYPQSQAEGFYCKPPETFLFVVSCASFLTAILYLFTCLLSKLTDVLLFQSSFEVSYFVLYFILILTASLTLIVSELNWGSERGFYENTYDSSQVAAIVGLINSILYGISAIWFFISHRLSDKIARVDHHP